MRILPSFFLLMTVQPCFFASWYCAWVKLPFQIECPSGNYLPV
jgi:hypothetical protein